MFYSRDYTKAIRKSFELLIRHNITWFPIDPFKIVSERGNWRLVKYTDLMSRNRCSIHEVVKKYGNDASTSKKNGICTIYYNDTKYNKFERIRFTIAHEIGHIMLGHFENDILKKLYPDGPNGKKDKDFNTKLELEADCFARNLLCPYVLIDIINQYLGEDEIVTLASIFNISNSAAKFRIKSLEWDRYHMKDFAFKSHGAIVNREYLLYNFAWSIDEQMSCFWLCDEFNKIHDECMADWVSLVETIPYC